MAQNGKETRLSREKTQSTGSSKPLSWVVVVEMRDGKVEWMTLLAWLDGCKSSTVGTRHGDNNG